MEKLERIFFVFLQNGSANKTTAYGCGKLYKFLIYMNLKYEGIEQQLPTN